MVFHGEWIDRLAVIPKDQSISVHGQINEIGHSKIVLENCELIDAVSSEALIAEAPTEPATPEPSILQPQAPEKPPREFVDARVTREFLKDLFEQNHFRRAEELAYRYIGKWMPISGPLGQIHPGSPRPDGSRFSMVTFSDMELPWFYMMFSDQWVDRMVLLPKGQNISLIGRV